MYIDVIIPTCKERKELRTSPQDGNKDLVSEVERTAGVPVNVIATCQPLCASANRNLGLDQATSDIRVMMDDDIEQMSHGWVRKMVAVMEGHPDCVMLTAELMSPNGTRGPMAGAPPRANSGVSVVPSRKLLTACIAIRRWPPQIRFDEEYIGSGFEDDDICAQLRVAYPNGVWMICHDVKLVHRNEMKGQAAPFAINRRRYEKKWNTKWK